MSKYFPITTYGMDVLRKETQKIQDVDTDLIKTIHRMFETMHNAEGIGLAAPQVNILKALTVIDLSGSEEYKKFKPLTMINPEILETHGEIEREEGCLSIPGLRAVVTRPEKVFFRYHDIDMNEKTMEADDLLARVVQHEIDHLHGKLFIDYLDADQMKELKKDLKDIKNKNIETFYPLFIHSELEY
ncbi:MAG: peptide deformylase [Ignavibacteriae bacterium]|nr:peptide deformylase [Ignavibacteriota bacterium]